MINSDMVNSSRPVPSLEQVEVVLYRGIEIGQWEQKIEVIDLIYYRNFTIQVP